MRCQCGECIFLVLQYVGTALRSAVLSAERGKYRIVVEEGFELSSTQNPDTLFFKAGHVVGGVIIPIDKTDGLAAGCGVTARLFWWGAAHTKGDELIMIEEDSMLIPGDIVQNKLVPNMPNEDASAKGWLAILDRLESLHPRLIVPDHGALGDGSLIGKERAFLADLRQRALELKRQGKTADEGGKQLQAEFKTKYPDWENLSPIPNAVKRVYEEGP